MATTNVDAEANDLAQYLRQEEDSENRTPVAASSHKKRREHHQQLKSPSLASILGAPTPSPNRRLLFDRDRDPQRAPFQSLDDLSNHHDRAQSLASDKKERVANSSFISTSSAGDNDNMTPIGKMGVSPIFRSPLTTTKPEKKHGGSSSDARSATSSSGRRRLIDVEKSPSSLTPKHENETGSTSSSLSQKSGRDMDSPIFYLSSDSSDNDDDEEGAEAALYLDEKIAEVEENGVAAGEKGSRRNHASDEQQQEGVEYENITPTNASTASSPLLTSSTTSVKGMSPTLSTTRQFSSSGSPTLARPIQPSCQPLRTFASPMPTFPRVPAPSPISPISPPPPGLQAPAPSTPSVDALISRAHAIHTPDVVEKERIKSWFSDRMLSAVKKFVWQDTQCQDLSGRPGAQQRQQQQHDKISRRGEGREEGYLSTIHKEGDNGGEFLSIADLSDKSASLSLAEVKGKGKAGRGGEVRFHSQTSSISSFFASSSRQIGTNKMDVPVMESAQQLLQQPRWSIYTMEPPVSPPRQLQQHQQQHHHHPKPAERWDGFPTIPRSVQSPPSSTVSSSGDLTKAVSSQAAAAAARAAARAAAVATAAAIAVSSSASSSRERPFSASAAAAVPSSSLSSSFSSSSSCVSAPSLSAAERKKEPEGDSLFSISLPLLTGARRGWGADSACSRHRPELRSGHGQGNEKEDEGRTQVRRRMLALSSTGDDIRRDSESGSSSSSMNGTGMREGRKGNCSNSASSSASLSSRAMVTTAFPTSPKSVLEVLAMASSSPTSFAASLASCSSSISSFRPASSRGQIPFHFSMSSDEEQEQEQEVAEAAERGLSPSRPPPPTARLPHLYSPLQPAASLPQSEEGRKKGLTTHRTFEGLLQESDVEVSRRNSAPSSNSSSFSPSSISSSSTLSPSAPSPSYPNKPTCITTIAATTAARPSPPVMPDVSLPITWREVLVGCAASRELQLRNCRPGPCIVHVAFTFHHQEDEDEEGGEAKREKEGCFHVSSCGKVREKDEEVVGADGILRLLITFLPVHSGLHRATLHLRVGVPVEEGRGAGEGKRGGGREEGMYDVDLVGTATDGEVGTAGGIGGVVKTPLQLEVNFSDRSAKNRYLRRLYPSRKGKDAAVAVGAKSLRISDESPMSPTHSTPTQPSSSNSAFLSSSSGTPGVGFAQTFINFGKQPLGSVNIQRVRLCNPLSAPQLVVLESASLPFVLAHRVIKLRPKAFVKLPLRFVPVHRGEFAVTLRANVHALHGEGQGIKNGGSSRDITLELRGQVE
ncbi:Hypothetical protein NocV09_00702150 [Nannochloropsis oceanica]